MKQDIYYGEKVSAFILLVCTPGLETLLGFGTPYRCYEIIGPLKNWSSGQKISGKNESRNEEELLIIIDN